MTGLLARAPHRVLAARLPPLILRLVVVHDGRQPCYLVTSVLNEKRLSNRQLATIYRLRWGIEVFYRHFKQTFERRKLRSKSAANIQVEADWSLLGLWAMALHAQSVLAVDGIPARRLSVASVLRAYRRAMREYKSRPAAGESLTELLRNAVIDSYKRGSKTSRGFPRLSERPMTSCARSWQARPNSSCA